MTHASPLSSSRAQAFGAALLTSGLIPARRYPLTLNGVALSLLAVSRPSPSERKHTISPPRNRCAGGEGC